MASPLNITLGSESVGTVTFTHPEPDFAAVRAISGFRVQLPALLTFRRPSDSQLPLVLENLATAISHRDHDRKVSLGLARCSGHLRTDHREAPITFDWEFPLSALAPYEQLRCGQPPVFDVMVSGDIRYVLPGQPGREPVSVAHQFHEPGQVSYQRDVWVRMLRSLNLQDAVIIEIPFLGDAPAGWEAVWSALRDARDSFDRGGSTGWNSCVAKVRLTLEEWKKVESEDNGPGWKRPSSADLQSRTKAQRIDNLRWHLHQLAHLAPHTRADDWRRETE